jgi:hypothetical protein
MGTRADFYIGRGKDAEWLGSTAWDGNPSGIDITTNKPDPTWPKSLGEAPKMHEDWPAGESLLESTTEEQFRDRLPRYFANRDDVTLPEHGWPWPWQDSQTTDYAYAFDGGHVWASCFGGEWFRADQPEPRDQEDVKVAVFPNMKARMAVTYGPRSGLIVLGSK